MYLLLVVLIASASCVDVSPTETTEDTLKNTETVLSFLKSESLERREIVNSLMEEVDMRLILIELLAVHIKVDTIIKGGICDMVLEKRMDRLEKFLGQKMDAIKVSLDDKMDGIRESLEEETINLRASLEKGVVNIKASLEESVASMNTSLIDRLESELDKGISSLRFTVDNEVAEVGSILNRTISRDINRINDIISDENSQLTEDIVAGCKAEANLGRSEIMDTVQEVGSAMGSMLERVDAKVSRVGNVVDLSRSEVRLISQQKLTWHNSTYSNNLNFASDYAVDGVYNTDPNYHSGSNPFQHIGSNRVNNMLILDLGALFRIHTIKVWNRVDCCQNQSRGVKVYAGDVYVGTLGDDLLYTFSVSEDVYTQKIYLKQSIPNWMNIRELQVFGTGPYGEDEI